MNDIKHELDNIIYRINSDYHDIKLSVYRTALKLCCLQDILKFQEVNTNSVFQCVKSACKSAQHKQIDCISNEVATFSNLYKIVQNIIKFSGIEVRSTKLCNFISTLIFEIYKDEKENKEQSTVALVAVVLFFIVLGHEEIKTKYKLLFNLYAGSLGMLSRSRAGLLLTHFVRITDIFGESNSFSKISPAVQSCFDGVLGGVISEDQLVHWMLKEPQTIVWLPTMHRLNHSKSSVHENIQCAVCQVRPIVGIRVQCLRCLDYDMCQICYLTQQKSSGTHNHSHPRQEYYSPAGSKDKINAFARTIRNIVTKRYKRKSPSSSFLPIAQNSEKSSPNDEVLKEQVDFKDVSSLASEEKDQLLELIARLKEENKKIAGTAKLLAKSKNESAHNDEDQLILQSKLDTVTQQNFNLQAELDNLKCVMFADDFLPSREQNMYDPRYESGSNYDGSLNTSLNNDIQSEKFDDKITNDLHHEKSENDNVPGSPAQNEFQTQQDSFHSSTSNQVGNVQHLPPSGNVSRKNSKQKKKIGKGPSNVNSINSNMTSSKIKKQNNDSLEYKTLPYDDQLSLTIKNLGLKIKESEVSGPKTLPDGEFHLAVENVKEKLNSLIEFAISIENQNVA